MSRNSASRTAAGSADTGAANVSLAPDRQKAEVLGELIGGIAHDCNNLLSGIVSHAELAIAESAAGVSPQEAIARIKTLALRTSEILRELMIYAGQETRAEEEVDLSELVAEMVQLLRVLVSKHVVVKTRLGRGLPAVKAFAPRLRQILVNLIVNASEAIGDREGVIGIATRTLRTTQDSVLAGGAHLAPGGYVVLEISDSGPGMSERTLARAFRPFFSTKPAGQGLGLAVVREIVAEHGGAVGLESAPGKGTAFYIFLPALHRTVTRRTGTVPSLAARVSPAGAHPSVLMVEDEDTLRLAVSKMLRKQGFSVLEAVDGYGAVETFREHASHIDVVLLDLTIRGAPSQYVFEQVRRIRPSVKFVLTSAYSRDMAVAQFDRLPSGFIRKPYQVPDLIRVLQAAISD